MTDDIPQDAAALAHVHRSVLDELETVVPHDLVEELEAMDVDGIGPDTTGG